MKDYNKIFADENKYIFDRRKELQNKVNQVDNKIGFWTFVLASLSFCFLLYFIYGWGFFGFRWEWAANFYKIFDENDTCIRILIACVGTIALVIFWVVTYNKIANQINKLHKKCIESDEKILKEKANEFASTTYLNDIFSALSTAFTLDSEFKDTFKTIIPKFEWFDYNGFRHYGTSLTSYQYDKDYNKVWIKESLIIRHEGSKYELERWECEKKVFYFFFKKINPNGLVEKDVEFRLPVIK